MMNTTTDLTLLKGVGAKMAERLGRLNIRSIPDLLFHLPIRYQDRTHLYPIGDCLDKQYAVIEGNVLQTRLMTTKRGRMLITEISDGSGQISIKFFHFNAGQKNAMDQAKRDGGRMRCFGEVLSTKGGLQMVHPEYKIVAEGQSMDVDEHLTPIYPTTEGLRQNAIRQLIEQALNYVQRHPALLEEFLSIAGLPSLYDAIRLIHYPTPDVSVAQLAEFEHPAQQKLIIEELTAHQLSMRLMRQRVNEHAAPALRPDSELEQQFAANLPFALTLAQQRVLDEVYHDLAQPCPMMRLVQGDVGSGKTVVAALAALRALSNGYQVAVMAPTEILAEQHVVNFARWMEPLGLSVEALLGKMTAKQKREALERVATVSNSVVVGTHALFQDDVAFQRLGLIIIDEQHRFGVHQRLALLEKGKVDGRVPHQLIMTATPIPRTLAMTAYADLDTSIIDELPPGRTPITTVVIPETKREQVIERISSACLEGRQAYWVCTLIEESEVLQCQAAEVTWEQLVEALPGVRVGLVHGRMKAADKQEIMAQFKAHELDLLVATTVIEVGVDVPNASLMIIENPERLGLAQLHQLRGRVGRGSVASHCVLLYRGPLSYAGKARLGVLRDSQDGFIIAEKDLEIRGPGEVLGTRQTGSLTFRIADIVRDRPLIPKAQQLARQFYREQPQQVERLIERWLADKTQYAVV
jgi:ATP-dependent DNA helicase RecG